MKQAASLLTFQRKGNAVPEVIVNIQPIIVWS